MLPAVMTAHVLETNRPNARSLRDLGAVVRARVSTPAPTITTTSVTTTTITTITTITPITT